MKKEIKISKTLANRLRRFKERYQSSLYLIGKNKKDVITRIFALPNDGGCNYTKAVHSASMAKSLLAVYKANLVPAGFFLIPTDEPLEDGTMEKGTLAARKTTKTKYIRETVNPIFECDLEFMTVSFPESLAIVVCEHNLYAAYPSESEHGVPQHLRIKEV